MTNEKKIKILEKSAENLGEHFDAVAIFAYDSASESGTFKDYSTFSGGITPMRAIVEDWVIRQKQYVKTHAEYEQMKQLQDEDEEGV